MSRLFVGKSVLLLFFIPQLFFSQNFLLAATKNSCDPPIPPFPIAYGELYMTGTAVQQTGIDGTPVLLTTFTNTGLASGTTPNAVSDIITVNTSGVYLVTLTLSIEGASGRVWTFQVANNGVAQPNLNLLIATTGTTNDTVSGATSGLLRLSAGDIISVLVSVTGAATTLVMESSNLHLTRIQ